MASKVLKMKMWPDETGGTWKHSVQDIKGEVLCVSQFTLLASTKKGNKPDFHGAASPEHARELYDRFYERVQELYDVEKVKNGVFQAMMEGMLIFITDLWDKHLLWNVSQHTKFRSCECRLLQSG